VTTTRIIELTVPGDTGPYRGYVVVSTDPDGKVPVTVRTTSPSEWGVVVSMEPGAVADLVEALREALAIMPSPVSL
jgi:hypothetical protein